MFLTRSLRSTRFSSLRSSTQTTVSLQGSAPTPQTSIVVTTATVPRTLLFSSSTVSGTTSTSPSPESIRTSNMFHILLSISVHSPSIPASFFSSDSPSSISQVSSTSPSSIGSKSSVPSSILSPLPSPLIALSSSALVAPISTSVAFQAPSSTISYLTTFTYDTIFPSGVPPFTSIDSGELGFTTPVAIDILPPTCQRTDTVLYYYQFEITSPLDVSDFISESFLYGSPAL